MTIGKFPFTWPQFPTQWKRMVRQELARCVEEAPDHEMTHEMIEEAIKSSIPDLEVFDVEDDDFRDFIGAIHNEYHRDGGVG